MALLSQAGGAYTVPSGHVSSKIRTTSVSGCVRNLRMSEAYVSSYSRTLSTNSRSKRGHQLIVAASPPTEEAVVATEPLTREDLIAYLASGCKTKDKWRIGTEHEKFGFEVNTLRPMKYEQIAELLNSIAERFEWEKVLEGDKIIGLKQGKQSISLEPGGQFELSGAPLETLHQTCAEVNSHLYQVKAVAEEMGIGFLGMGFQPKWRREDIPIMPKGRYDIMRNYMPKVGSLGLDMMLRTCTVQVNLDFSSEADMIRKFRVGLALQPIATALFANSPFTEGKPNGFLSMRSHIWTDTDKDRTGMLPFVFDDSFGFEQYVDYALDVPMYFAYRNNKYVDCTGMTFRQFLAGKLPCLPGELPTYNDWENHLTTIFPEVRLKRYMEMRGADGGPWRRLCALPAFWVGLFYDEPDVKEEDDGNRGSHAASGSSNDEFMFHQSSMQDQVDTPGGSRRSRPVEEKERTKLRERHRRAITARILGGLRRHGNYNLRVRADINDVIAALAREAGWVVLPDGTTFPSKSQGTKPPPGGSSASHQSSPPALRGGSLSGHRSPTELNTCRMKGVFAPTTPSPYDVQSSELVGSLNKGDGLIGCSVDVINSKQILEIPPNMTEQDFSGTPYVPVYVMLPLGVINMKCELADRDGLLKHLRILKSIQVDGVKVDCWWGIAECHSPQEYNWNGYRQLFQIVRDLNLKIQVLMSFHECGGNVGDDVCIPLPHWVAEIGRTNPDIYFTDREGRRNPECLSWGIDKERVLRGRTALEVYFDYMRSFRIELAEFVEDGVISMVEIGLGPCGELRYPSCPIKHGWRYPGVGEFQCYDKYLLKSLRKAAESRGHPFWARGPENAGSYNSQPQGTGFFCDGGDYDGLYGRFFLKWYSQVLIDHADKVLSLAKLVFDTSCIAAKLPDVHWWYRTASHAAELTAGFYNPSNRDGYAEIASTLKKHGAALSFVSGEVQVLNRPDDFSGALGEPEAVAWQVLNAAWDTDTPIARENSLPCHDRVGFNKMLESVKFPNDPDRRHLSSFAYSRLVPALMEGHNLVEFDRFVKKLHGEAVMDHQHHHQQV